MPAACVIAAEAWRDFEFWMVDFEYNETPGRGESGRFREELMTKHFRRSLGTAVHAGRIEAWHTQQN